MKKFNDNGDSREEIDGGFDKASSEVIPKKKYSSDESSEEDNRELEGNVYTKAGLEVKYNS